MNSADLMNAVELLAALWGALWVALVLSVSAHEAAHAMVLRHRGHPLRIFCFGIALCRLTWSHDKGWHRSTSRLALVESDDSFYDDPSSVRLVAAAGPSVNLVLGLIFTVALAIVDPDVKYWQASCLRDYVCAFDMTAKGLVAILATLNLVMVLNLVPCTSRDGKNPSDGMFVFNTKKAIAIVKAAKAEQAAKTASRS